MIITPDWPVPKKVNACITTRQGGKSGAPFNENNLGHHVGDDPQVVAQNRFKVSEKTGVDQWQWLNQVHGVDVVEASGNDDVFTADGSYTSAANLACSVLTADCLPLLLCNAEGSKVAAVHAGWRGLAGGVIAKALNCFDCASKSIFVYLGPAIGPKCFEVDGPVLQAFSDLAKQNNYSDLWKQAFTPRKNKAGHYLADIYALARWQLLAEGVTGIYGGAYCTVSQADLFYSYRRDGVTGRMASAIWLSDV